MIREIDATEFLSALAITTYNKNLEETLSWDMQEIFSFANRMQCYDPSIRVLLDQRSLMAFQNRSYENIMISESKIEIKITTHMLSELENGLPSISIKNLLDSLENN